METSKNNTIPESIREKLRKVLALAQNGEAGERSAAQTLLKKLLADNGLTFADLDDNETEVHYFKIGRSADMRALMCQIYFMVTNTHRTNTWTSNSHPGCIGFEVTRVQAADMEAYYSVLAPAMKKEMERLRRNMQDAFFLKNGLYAASSEPNHKLTDEEIQHLKHIWALQNAVEKVEFRRQIGK